MITRRGFVGAAAVATAAGQLGAFQETDPAKEMAAVLKRIKPPAFPNRAFDITKYGAVAGKDASDAISKAIAECSKAGGGRVVVPKGDFLTGAIHLKSNVNLHLEEGSTLLFDRDPKRYPMVLTRFEGSECMNYSPFIYAFEQTNIAVSGTGMLDGQADNEHWWHWSGGARFGGSPDKPNQRKATRELVAMADKDTPVKDRVFGDGWYLRPNFFQPYRCTNVLIENVSIRNSPMWELNPVLCKNVTVRGVKISTHGPNNDGCDPESCSDVLIEQCVFDTGDDCIAIKSGRNRDGRRINMPSENIVVRNCQMKDGHGGVSLGSECSGGIRNIFIDHNRMDSPRLDRALRIKTNTYRGGVMENIYFTNTEVGEVAEAVVEVTYFYMEGDNREGQGGPFKPLVRNVVVQNVTSKKSKNAVYLRGSDTAPVTGIRISHCSFDNVAQDDVIQHVQGLKLEDVKRNGKPMTAPA